jgi:hypothetical protein
MGAGLGVGGATAGADALVCALALEAMLALATSSPRQLAFAKTRRKLGFMFHGARGLPKCSNSSVDFRWRDSGLVSKEGS